MPQQRPPPKTSYQLRLAFDEPADQIIPRGRRSKQQPRTVSEMEIPPPPAAKAAPPVSRRRAPRKKP
jgi:hypothetical protein